LAPTAGTQKRRRAEDLKPRIISASRRTDIPAFYGTWLLNRLRAGWALTYNPFNRRPMAVSLRPQDVAGIVLWSKNFGPFLTHAEEIRERGFNCFFLFTITGLPRLLEPHTPPVKEAVAAFRTLARRFSPHHLVWRYDPILLSPLTDPAYHLRTFGHLCRQLGGYTFRCYVSFLDFYPKVRRRLERLSRTAGLELLAEPLPETKLELLRELAKAAAKHNIEVRVCSEDLPPSTGLKKARCIDPELLAPLFGLDPALYPPKPTRPGCGCHESVDIGVYETCPHLCEYCYANTSPQRVLSAYRQHEPTAPALVEPGSSASPFPR